MKFNIFYVLVQVITVFFLFSRKEVFHILVDHEWSATYGVYNELRMIAELVMWPLKVPSNLRSSCSQTRDEANELLNVLTINSYSQKHMKSSRRFDREFRGAVRNRSIFGIRKLNTKDKELSKMGDRRMNQLTMQSKCFEIFIQTRNIEFGLNSINHH